VFAVMRLRAAPAGSYVSVELEGAIEDVPPPPGPFRLLRRARGRSVSVMAFRELGQLVARDPHVAGVLGRIRMPGHGSAAPPSLRDVLSEIRAAGKDVVAYLPLGAGNRELFVASAARLVLVGPEITVAPVGFANRGRYVRRALERVGVEPEVFS